MANVAWPHDNISLSFDCYLFNVYVCFVCNHVCVSCVCRPEEGVRAPVTGVTGCWMLSGECWESNPGPPDKQAVLSMVEPSLLFNVIIFGFSLGIKQSPTVGVCSTTEMHHNHPLCSSSPECPAQPPSL